MKVLLNVNSLHSYVKVGLKTLYLRINIFTFASS